MKHCVVNQSEYNEAVAKVGSEIVESSVKSARGLSKWLELDFSLKIFGVELIHWHYPPTR